MAENSNKSSGTVKWFNGWKGFGFITPDDQNSDDIFVHQTSIDCDGYRTLHDGQRVDYDVEVGEDGRSRAVNVVGGQSSGNRGGKRGGRSAGGGGGGGGAVECYNCGQLGHFARDCSGGGGGGGGGGGRRGGRGGRRGGFRGRGGEGRGRGRGRGSGGCYNCGEEGHFARDCSNNPQN